MDIGCDGKNFHPVAGREKKAFEDGVLMRENPDGGGEIFLWVGDSFPDLHRSCLVVDAGKGDFDQMAVSAITWLVCCPFDPAMRMPAL